MKNKSMTKLLSILLAVVMLFTIMPSDVYASSGKSVYSTKFKLNPIKQESGCDVYNCSQYATKKQPIKYVDGKNSFGHFIGWTGYHKDCKNFTNKNVFSHGILNGTPVQFTDAKLKGTPLSDKKVKISWTKCEDADGYQIVLTTRISAVVEGDEIHTDDIFRVACPSQYRTIKTINKNINSITLSTPKAVDEKFGIVHDIYSGPNCYKKIVDTEQGVFYIRYRVYKKVNKKKVWSKWSQTICVAPKGKSYKSLVKTLDGYKNREDYDFSELYYHNSLMCYIGAQEYVLIKGTEYEDSFGVF